MTFDQSKYFNTLKLIFMKGVYDYDQDAKVKVRHSLNGGIYICIVGDKEIDEKGVEEIKANMRETILEDIPINKVVLSKKDLGEKVCFGSRGDLCRLYDTTTPTELSIYELGGFYDYFHNDMYPSTGYVSLYDVTLYRKGVILKFPKKSNPHSLEVVEDQVKLGDTFDESNRWGEILGVEDVGAVNEKIETNAIIEHIRVNEALHNKKISDISEEILSKREKRLILVAGPSSSGKTTFTKKLAIYLRACGLTPTMISLDNYYRGRKYVPLDKDGKKDFEALEALDVELFSKQVKELLDGKGVEVPIYNFYSGEREKKGVPTKLGKDGVILVEGIHGLNDKLTPEVPVENKYKVYISCLTTLNIDDHNRIPTNEVRKLRRIVRDSLSRGTSAEVTLSMWDSVRRGEENHIFPFQEKANVIFDSNLTYELSVLKKHALKNLTQIKVTDPHFDEAHKLIKFLNYFKDIDDNLVPDDSILKEFIGGSYFYKY